MDNPLELIARHLDPWTLEMAGRLAIAMVLGAVLGLDREFRNRPAGLRSHILVALASASFTLMTYSIVDLWSRDGEIVQVDPMRLLEAIVTGISFLGAGTIIQSRGTVLGVTTGASLWLTGAIGVACGIGNIPLAVVTTAFGIIVLLGLGKLQERVRRSADSHTDRSADTAS